MKSRSIFIFREDKLGWIAGLMMFFSFIIISYRLFINRDHSKIFAGVLNGDFAAMLIVFAILFLFSMLVIGIVVSIYGILGNRRLSIFSEGFSFYDDALRTRIHLKWEELNSVLLKRIGSGKDTRNLMHINDETDSYKIDLDCLMNNPVDVSDRMKIFYYHWKNGDLSRSGFKPPYYPNKLTNKNLLINTVIVIVDLFIIYKLLQSTEIVILYNEILFNISGISRALLLSATSINIMNILCEILDHFDIRDNERKYENFIKYSSITTYLLLNLAMITVNFEITH